MKPDRHNGKLFTKEQAKLFGQLPYFLGEYRAAFSPAQVTAWNEFARWGLVDWKRSDKPFSAGRYDRIKLNGRVYTKTEEGAAEEIAYQVSSKRAPLIVNDRIAI